MSEEEGLDSSRFLGMLSGGDGPGLTDALNKEDDLGAFIRAHMHFESTIDKFFQKSLVEASAISWTRYGFSFKIELLSGLGVLSPENIRILTLVNRLRNRFAHSLEYQITIQDAQLLYDCLPPVGVEAVERGIRKSQRPPEYTFALRWRATIAVLYMNFRDHLEKVFLPLDMMTATIRQYQSGFWKFIPEGLDEWLQSIESEVGQEQTIEAEPGDETDPPGQQYSE
jgi:hypothetical protein